MGLKASDLPLALREKLGLEKPTVNKYGVAPVADRTTDGIKFHSKAEMHRYRELGQQQKSGTIVYFLRQVPFHLPGGVSYRVDFMVVHPDNRIVYEDVKGVRTPEYKIKRKLVEAIYPVVITEIHRDPMRRKPK